MLLSSVVRTRSAGRLKYLLVFCYCATLIQATWIQYGYKLQIDWLAEVYNHKSFLSNFKFEKSIISILKKKFRYNAFLYSFFNVLHAQTQ